MSFWYNFLRSAPTQIYIVPLHSNTGVHLRYVTELGTLTLREPCCVSAVASGFILCESVLWVGYGCDCFVGSRQGHGHYQRVLKHGP